jgi:hypothetical protein
MEQPLVEACISDRRFDAQCEDSRGEWLWRILEATGSLQRLRVPILHALHELADERSAVQLCELARCFAGMGDRTFRDQLYEIVERRPLIDCPWLGEKEIITLDGQSAFLFVARSRGKRLESRDWEWDDGSLINEAVERFGEERVNILLSSSIDAAIERFGERWRQEKSRKAEAPPHQSHRERMRSIAVGEVFRAAEGDTNCYWFRGWGMHAEEVDLDTVLARIWAEKAPLIVTKLLRVFTARPLPNFDSRLIELCRHPDEEIRNRARIALAENSHSSVREFVETEIQKRTVERNVLRLFVKNYRRGDEHRILEAMELPDNACELHWLLMDVIEVLEENAEADCSRLAVVSYASTPCQNCRFDAARLLFKRHAAPPWLIEECPDDAETNTRALVAQAT